MSLNIARRAFLAAAPASVAGATLANPAETDPILPLYREWLAAREAWLLEADKPGNGNWESPQSIEAAKREYAALDAMLDLTPTTLEGAAALAHILWIVIGPISREDHPDYQTECERDENRLIASIWRAGSGRGGLPGGA